jgi:hypothetical protein
MTMICCEMKRLYAGGCPSRFVRVRPWSEFCALIEPYYPKVGKGRPVGLERMLHMYFLANWFHLADEACEETLYIRYCLVPGVSHPGQFVRIAAGLENAGDLCRDMEAALAASGRHENPD